MGPKAPRSTVLSSEEEAIIIAFRKHTLLPLDDCIYALQATIPRLTRSSLHRYFKRHGMSWLQEITGDKTAKKPFKRCPIGYFHLDIAEVRTENCDKVVQQIKDEGALPVIPCGSGAIKKAYCPSASTRDATKSKTTSAVSRIGGASPPATTNSAGTSSPPRPLLGALYWIKL